MTTSHTPEKSSDSPWHVFQMRLQPRPLRSAEGIAPSFGSPSHSQFLA